MTAGLKEELEVLSNARENDDEASDPLRRAESRAPDWSDVDALLEGLEG